MFLKKKLRKSLSPPTKRIFVGILLKQLSGNLSDLNTIKLQNLCAKRMQQLFKLLRYFYIYEKFYLKKI